jgi:hypothetical protein
VIRLLAYLWASPNSLLGLLFGLTGKQWRWQRGVLEITDSCFLGLLGRNAQAVTLGHVILARHSDALDYWREHERRHVRQYEWFGPLFLPAYLGLALVTALRGRHFYRDHPLEREAGLHDFGPGSRD